jgi:hypothetical protein
MHFADRALFDHFAFKSDFFMHSWDSGLTSSVFPNQFLFNAIGRRSSGSNSYSPWRGLRLWGMRT